MEVDAAKDAAEKSNSVRIAYHDAVWNPTAYEAEDASGSRTGASNAACRRGTEASVPSATTATSAPSATATATTATVAAKSGRKTGRSGHSAKAAAWWH